MDIQAFIEHHGPPEVFWPQGWDFPPVAPWLPVLYPELAERLRPTPPPPPDRTAEARALLEAWGVCEETFWPQGWDFPPMAPWLAFVDPGLADRLRPPSPPRPRTFQLWGGYLRVTTLAPPRAPVLPLEDGEDCDCGERRGRRRRATDRGDVAVTVEWLDNGGQVLHTSRTPIEGVGRLLQNGLPQWLDAEHQGELSIIGAEVDVEWAVAAGAVLTDGEISDSFGSLFCDAPPDCPTERVPAIAKDGSLVFEGDPCCRWRSPKDIDRYYVSKSHGDIANDGTDSSRPTTLAGLRAQLLLEDKDTVLPRAVAIFFLQGDEWTYEDAVADPVKPTWDSQRAFLHIYASGTEEHPIFIGSYYDAAHSASTAPPLFIGDGSITPNGSATAPTHTVTRAKGYGFLLVGARWVQIADIAVTNCSAGIAVRSFDNDRRPTTDAPLRGARDINLLNLTIYENWVEGIAIGTRLDSVGDKLTELDATVEATDDPQFVIGRDSLQVITRDAKTGGTTTVAIEVDREGWWCERVCIEDCSIYANGDGANSNGGNIGLSNFASLCLIRRNRIYGAPHSRSKAGWYNQCGRYLAGVEAAGSEVSFQEPWTDAEGFWQAYYPELWATWGTDGLTMTNGGCGNILENNLFHRHVVGQAAGGSCGGDDGNGVDLKGAGNRTYFQRSRGWWVLCDLPNVVRNNLFSENMGPAIVVHFGCRNLHIYNNQFSHNYANEGAAIAMITVDLSNGIWESEYSEGDYYDSGNKMPGLTQDVYIYRNMVFRNGFVPAAVAGSNNDVMTPAGFGANALSIESPSAAGRPHGSRDGMYFINNTVADNKGYGLFVELVVVTGVPDEDEYYFNNLVIVNNIFSGNTGKIIYDPHFQNEVQIAIRDEMVEVDSARSFLCEIQINNNCYYSTKVTGVVSFAYDSGTPNELTLSDSGFAVFCAESQEWKREGPVG